MSHLRHQCQHPVYKSVCNISTRPIKIHTDVGARVSGTQRRHRPLPQAVLEPRLNVTALVSATVKYTAVNNPQQFNKVLSLRHQCITPKKSHFSRQAGTSGILRWSAARIGSRNRVLHGVSILSGILTGVGRRGVREEVCNVAVITFPAFHFVPLPMSGRTKSSERTAGLYPRVSEKKSKSEWLVPKLRSWLINPVMLYKGGWIALCQLWSRDARQQVAQRSADTFLGDIPSLNARQWCLSY